MRTHKLLVSVTADSKFAYVECGCGHITIKREGNRIVLVAGPGCQFAVSGDPDTITVSVSSKEVEKPPSNLIDFISVHESAPGPERSRGAFAFVSGVGGLAAAPVGEGRGS
jgi:hypothetical protein